MSKSTQSDRELTKKATVIIVTYNHVGFIRDCLRTVLGEEPSEVIVVDSGSSDRTKSIVSNFPEVTLLTPEENRGYGAGNNVGVKETSTEYTIVLNPDTKIEDGCFKSLLRPLAEHDRLITTPKILTYDGSRINTCGNIDHFTGLGFTRGLHCRPTEYSEQKYLSGISGACFALRTDLYRDLGGFDESFFLYMEDVELSWRAAVEEVDILYVPDAIVYHDYEDVSVPSEKIYHVERGRYFTLRKHLDHWTVLLMLPSLFVTELLTTGYAGLNGIEGIQNKLRAMKDGLSTPIDQHRKNPRTALMRLATEIPEDQLTYGAGDRFAKLLANAVYRINYRLLKV